MEIENQAILDYFFAIGFELVPIEEGLTALSFEEAPDGEYALITNEDGSLPESLEIPLMLACYTAEGAFLWSTGFKNAAQFKEVWSQGETYKEKLQAAQRHREEVMDPRLRMQL
jgi:hypothetical protein